jgi:hypothetical protein
MKSLIQGGMVTTLVWVVLIGLAPGECEAMEMGAISVIDQVSIDISTGQFRCLIAAALITSNQNVCIPTYFVYHGNLVCSLH